MTQSFSLTTDCTNSTQYELERRQDGSWRLIGRERGHCVHKFAAVDEPTAQIVAEAWLRGRAIGASQGHSDGYQALRNQLRQLLGMLPEER